MSDLIFSWVCEQALKVWLCIFKIILLKKEEEIQGSLQNKKCLSLSLSFFSLKSALNLLFFCLKFVSPPSHLIWTFEGSGYVYVIVPYSFFIVKEDKKQTSELDE